MTSTLMRWGAGLLGRAYRRYYGTLDVRGLMPDGTTVTPATYPFGPEIIALCERDALALAGVTARAGFIVLVSHGRDGDWASAALEAIGCHVVRGSSLRGGTAALLALVDAVGTSSRPAAVVVDGPLGPSGVAKPGIVACARRTGRPVRALGVAARHCIEFSKVWSRIYLPLPFTRVQVVIDGAEPMPDIDDRDAVGAAATRLSQRLAAARECALRLVHEAHAGA